MNFPKNGKEYLALVDRCGQAAADIIVDISERTNEIIGGVDLRKLLAKKRKRKEHEWPDKWRNDYGTD